MKKIFIITLLSLFAFTGCSFGNKKEEPVEEKVDGYLPTMVEIHKGSKQKINDAYQKENERLEEGLQQEK